MKLQVNESPIDRLVRIVVGVALFAAAAAGIVGAPVLYLAWLGGAIMIATGVVGFCPLYAILRFSTLPARR